MRVFVSALVVAALATAACSSSSASAKQVPSQPRMAAAPMRQPEVRPATSSYAPRSTARAFVPVAAPASSRSWNATCPVLVGNPVDANYASTWNGRTIAFSSPTAKLMWDADPARYAGNLPGASGSAGDLPARPVAVAPAAPATTRPLPTAAPLLRPAIAAKPAPTAVVTPPAAVHPDAEPKPADGECEDCPGGVCRVPGR